MILSFPGLGVQLGTRVPAEIGDDRKRFADARGLKAFAGSSPITRASGKESSITRRWVKNDRLNYPPPWHRSLTPSHREVSSSVLPSA